MLPLFLCQNYLFIFLFWSRLGLSISDLALADSVYPCCHSLSDGVQFLNLHRFSVTPSWHALFLICNVLTVRHSHPLQPCHISSCSYRFPFPAALPSKACTRLNIQSTAFEGAMCLPLTRWSTAPPVCQAGTVNFKEGSIGPQANGSKVPTGFMCSNCTPWGVTWPGHCKLKNCKLKLLARDQLYIERASLILHLMMSKKLLVVVLKIPGHRPIVNTAFLRPFPFYLSLSLLQLYVPWRKP